MSWIFFLMRLLTSSKSSPMARQASTQSSMSVSTDSSFSLFSGLIYPTMVH